MVQRENQPAVAQLDWEARNQMLRLFERAEGILGDTGVRQGTAGETEYQLRRGNPGTIVLEWKSGAQGEWVPMYELQLYESSGWHGETEVALGFGDEFPPAYKNSTFRLERALETVDELLGILHGEASG